MEDYLGATEGLNVVKAVYMEVAVEAKQRVDEADYVVDLCRRKVGPTVSAVIGGAPEREDFAQYIERFKGSPYVKGVRSSFDTGRTSEHFVKNLRMLGQMGMCYDINTGPAGLAAAAKIADQCPDTRFVLDHCGNVNPAVFRKPNVVADGGPIRAQWERGIAMLAERRNVVCKISGVMESGEPERAGVDEYVAVINVCFDHFGADRVIFASNWPVVNRGGSLTRWVEIVREATRAKPETDRRKLFYSNAQHFYGLA